MRNTSPAAVATPASRAPSTARVSPSGDGIGCPRSACRASSRVNPSCHAYLRFAKDHPGHYRVLFSAAALGPKGVGTYGRSDHPGAASFIALVDSVQRCLDAGASAHTDRGGFFLAIQLWTWLHDLVDLRISKPEMPWPAVGALLEATLSDLGLSG